MSRALVIPFQVEHPVFEFDLNDKDHMDTLAQLQDLVDGHVQAIPCPRFFDPNGDATCYLNEDGKYIAYTDPEGETHEGLPFNSRATDLLVPGVGLFMGDYIAGDLVVVGFDIRTGGHKDVPSSVEERIRKIEQEA